MDNMDYKLVSGVLGVVCLLLASYVVVVGSGAGKTVYVNNTVYPKQGLSVYYLYPLRCVSCDLNTQGACDYCTSYYGAQMMDSLSQSVGVPINYVVSDVVARPNIVMVNGEKLTLADGRSKYNIAHALCGFAGVKESCSLFSSEIDRVKSCVKKYGIDASTVVYTSSSKECPLCSKENDIVAQLFTLEFSDGVEYKVKSVDYTNSQERQLVSDCMQAFDNLEYVPQLLCPANGKQLTGEFTLSAARDFADECMGVN